MTKWLVKFKWHRKDSYVLETSVWFIEGKTAESAFKNRLRKVRSYNRKMFGESGYHNAYIQHANKVGE